VPEMPTPGLHLPRPARRIVKALFWCQVLAIAWFSLLGGDEQARLRWLTGLDDHAMHSLAFLLASVTAGLVWTPLSAVAVLLGMGAACIELAQALAPGRHPSLVDLSASALGIAAGALVVRHVWPKLSRRLLAAEAAARK